MSYNHLKSLNFAMYLTFPEHSSRVKFKYPFFTKRWDLVC
jgi:hypothetical protein